jgi:hypothetical protein
MKSQAATHHFMRIKNTMYQVSMALVIALLIAQSCTFKSKRNEPVRFVEYVLTDSPSHQIDTVAIGKSLLTTLHTKDKIAFQMDSTKYELLSLYSVTVLNRGLGYSVKGDSLFIGPWYCWEKDKFDLIFDGDQMVINVSTFDNTLMEGEESDLYWSKGHGIIAFHNRHRNVVVVESEEISGISSTLLRTIQKTSQK